MQSRFLGSPVVHRVLGLLAPTLLLGAASLHCAGGDSPQTAPSETDAGGETSTGDGGSDVATDGEPGDTGPDAPPVNVTCTKPPSFAAPLRVNHNPDSLRHVARAGMVQLEDGRLMVAMLEALDTGSRYGVFVRTVDPVAGTVSPDERLDVDADNLTSGSALTLATVPGGAVSLRYGGDHLRVFSKGKWSPDLSPVSGTIGMLAAPNGQVLLTRLQSGSPSAQAIVYRPDEGGIQGSWSTLQPLDIDGASANVSRVERHVLADGRFLTLIWQGPGGPSIRIRSLSGSWSEPYAKPDVGASNVEYRLLADESIVLVALEDTGTGTHRAVTTTWTAKDGWSTTRLLSKPTVDTNGVLPGAGYPLLFDTPSGEVEFVAWVAACVGAAADCQFEPVSRKYAGGEWKDPTPLAVGAKFTGADGLALVRLDESTPLHSRRQPDGLRIDARARVGNAWSGEIEITKDSPLFGSATLDPQYYGGAVGVWSVVRRNAVADGASLASVMGKIDTAGAKAAWGLITAGSYEVRDFGSIRYVDGAGGFTLGSNGATDGVTNAPIIAHAGAKGDAPEAVAVISSDESSASFAAWPKTAARPGRDKAAIFVVAAQPTDGSGTRLRAYAWNGVGSGVPKLLANESRAPRAWSDSVLVNGCGGAILYAVDPADGSHALELVLVKEATGS